MSKNLLSLICGIIFGIGLVISGMTNPAKVIGFLNITGNWDPSLVFVMFGAIAITSPSIYLLNNRNKPLFSSSFQVPARKTIDQKLVIGSSLFGIGWGMVGLCPGPAISSIALLNVSSGIFVISMFIGFYIAYKIN